MTILRVPAFQIAAIPGDRPELLSFFPELILGQLVICDVKTINVNAVAARNRRKCQRE
jgi:hypothetical protein